MIFRIYHEDTMYVLEAPEGSKIVAEGDQREELVVFQVTPGGTCVERRLPPSVVVKAAHRGSMGLAILQRRSPEPHPELAPSCPLK